MIVSINKNCIQKNMGILTKRIDFPLVFFFRTIKVIEVVHQTFSWQKIKSMFCAHTVIMVDKENCNDIGNIYF